MAREDADCGTVPIRTRTQADCDQSGKKLDTKTGKATVVTRIAESVRRTTTNQTGLRETDEDTSALATDGKT